MPDLIFSLARPLLHALDPETAHGVTLRALRAGLYTRRPNDRIEALHTEVAGLKFPNPFGMAAGFDKNAEVADAVLNLGFGFAEVGTVTPKPQAGNPRPRLFRLPRDGAVINRMGFNNDGHAAVRERLLARAGHSGIVGVNIGANKDAIDRIGDYCAGLEAFHDIASYIAVNVSSPNTPGLRDLQARRALEDLTAKLVVTRIRLAASSGREVPIFLKISPDLSSEELEDIVGVAVNRNLDGLIVANTTIERNGLIGPGHNETGGLSGQPLFEPSTRILAHAYRLAGGRIPLIGVGGVSGVRHAYAKIKAGASLIQLYTALVYQGPGLIARLVDGLGEALARDGLTSIQQAVGVEAQQ